MSTTLAPRSVPSRYRVAAVISVALAVFDIVFSVPSINQGSSGNSSGVPWGVIIASFVISIIVCVAAYGVLVGQRWGVILTIVMNALSFIIGAPGVLFAPHAWLRVSSAVFCVANLLVIGLLLRRGRRGAAAGAASSREATV